MEKQGDKVTRGYLEGDMEFWDDGVAFKRDGQGEKSGDGQS